MQAYRRALTIWMLDRRHLRILAGCIKYSAIVGNIPISHVFVQPVQPVTGQRDNTQRLPTKAGFTNQSPRAYNQLFQVAHRVAQRLSRGEQ